MKQFIITFLSGITVLSAAAVAPSRAQDASVRPPLKKSEVRTFQRVKTAGSTFRSPFPSAAKDANVPVVSRRTPMMGEAGKMPKFIGSVIYSSTWTDEEAIGLYTVPSAAGESFSEIVFGPDGTRGGALVGNTYYYCKSEMMFETVWNTMTGVDITTGDDIYFGDISYPPTTMTSDPTTGDVYAIANIEGTFELVKVVFEQYDATYEELCVISYGNEMTDWNSLACDAQGQFYGIAAQFNEYNQCLSSALVKIDPSTGTITEIGSTGEVPQYYSSAVIDPESGRMFWTLSPEDGTGWLCEVDLTTGAATRLYEFPGQEEVTGLAIMPPAAASTAPAEVTGASAVFEGGSLSGYVKFTAPTTTYEGTPATGALTYSVTANGIEVGSGDTAYGEEVSANVTLDEAGLYDFVITVSNADGTSPAVTLKGIYVGNDTPEATSATLVYENGNMKLSWLPVTASINGGYLDTEAIRYTVTRFPGEVKVAENITETSFSEPIEAGDGIVKYYYTVTASANGLTSAAAMSNSVTLGSLTPPYTANFENDFDLFTVIDANGDGTAWRLFNGQARIGYNSTLAMDDWLVAPPMDLKGGKIYELAAEFASMSSMFPERVEIKAGKAPTAEAMNITLLEPTDITAQQKEPYKWNGSFSPEDDGIYYIGIHGISDADGYYLYMSSFSISAPKGATTPGGVTGLTVTPGEYGALSARIAFTTPTLTIDGDPLESLTRVEILRGEESVKTWENPGMGVELSFDDAVPALGDYTHTVTCYNESGTGGAVTATAYIGVDYPAAPQNIVATETSVPGEVTVRWDAVTTGKGGSQLNPEQVKYQVYRYSAGAREPISELITATSYTYQAVQPGKQDFLQFAVFAYTDRGEGLGNVSNFMVAGTPYDGLTFTNDADFENYVLGISAMGGARWTIGSDTSVEGVTAQDADNFYLYMAGTAIGDYGELYTGWITLENMTKPLLTFYTFCIDTDDANTIDVRVREKGQADYTTLKTVTVSETGSKGWNKVSVDLSAYAGKVIQLDFLGTIKVYTMIFMDNIVVANDNSSAISSVQDEAVTVSVVNRDIVISGAAGLDVAVYTVDGHTLFAGKGDAKTVVAAQQGVYVVKAGKTVKKVLVR